MVLPRRSSRAPSAWSSRFRSPGPAHLAVYLPREHPLASSLHPLTQADTLCLILIRGVVGMFHGNICLPLSLLAGPELGAGAASTSLTAPGLGPGTQWVLNNDSGDGSELVYAVIPLPALSLWSQQLC